MNTNHNQTLLIAILADYGNSPFSVTSVRDEFIQRSAIDKQDSAKLRRWIAGKFVTFERWQWIKKHSDPIKSRDYYTALPKFANELSNPSTLINEVKTPQEKLNPSSELAIEKLSGELEHYRRAIITQLSEIEEYKRVQTTYPELKHQAQDRFQEVLEENYRLLGKVKALESLVTNEDKNTT